MSLNFVKHENLRHRSLNNQCSFPIASNIDYICMKGGGGVQIYNFGKFNNEIWVEGWFWVRVLNVAQVRPRSKNGDKNQNLHLKSKEVEL